MRINSSSFFSLNSNDFNEKKEYNKAKLVVIIIIIIAFFYVFLLYKYTSTK